MRFIKQPKLIALTLGLIVIILLAIILLPTSRISHLFFNTYPAVGILVFLISLTIFLVTLLNNPKLLRIYSAIFPILLIAGIALNVWWFDDLNQDRWGMKRHPSNETLDLLSAPLGLPDQVAVYTVLNEHYQDKQLFVTPGLLTELKLSAQHMIAWGRMSSVEEEDVCRVPDLMTGEIEQHLIHVNHFELTLRSGDRYVFVIDDRFDDAALCMGRLGERIFIVPVSLLTNSVES